jgi:hypothetical protein
MLPPFVPPSARVASERLPLITQFVIDRVEHSFESSFSFGGAEGGVATLPSIDEFVRSPAESGAGARSAETTGDDEFVQRTSRSPWGTYEARHEVAGSTESAPAASARGTLEPDLLLDHRSPPAGSEDAIVNEVAEPADAWAASAASSNLEKSTASTTGESSEAAEAQPETSTPSTQPEIWVAEERDAFDWHAAANLALPPAEAQRAAEEWSTTEWDRSSGSVQDHVAAMLAQISRRVRSGELEVQGSKQMGSEAALVAALSALLAESSKK